MTEEFDLQPPQVEGALPAPALLVVAGFLAMLTVLLPTISLPVAAAPSDLSGATQQRSSKWTLRLDPEQTKIEFRFGATFHKGEVEGSMKLVRGEIQFDPLSETASGEVVADATSGFTGNEGRDKNMHKDVLESRVYPEIIFTPLRFEGDFYPEGESDVLIAGNLDIHGSKHEITLLAHVRADGDRLSGSASFKVPYVEWGMKNASRFILRVNKVIQVNLQISGTFLAGDTNQGSSPAVGE
ncbi:MAG: YceI family protein [Acidobacteriota bacterium]